MEKDWNILKDFESHVDDTIHSSMNQNILQFQNTTQVNNTDLFQGHNNQGYNDIVQDTGSEENYQQESYVLSDFSNNQVSGHQSVIAGANALDQTEEFYTPKPSQEISGDNKQSVSNTQHSNYSQLQEDSLHINNKDDKDIKDSSILHKTNDSQTISQSATTVKMERYPKRTTFKQEGFYYECSETDSD